jgi:hypothetical protein
MQSKREKLEAQLKNDIALKLAQLKDATEMHVCGINVRINRFDKIDGSVSHYLSGIEIVYYSKP